MRTITRTAFAIAGAVALVGGASMSASAADTTATVEVTAGGLTISAPATVALSNAAPGTTATAAFGATTVSDLTADADGWVAAVTVSDFVGADAANVIPAARFSYTAAAPTTTGTSTVATDDDTDTMTATAVVGNNTATWGSTIGLTIPADALADIYTATITSSVL